MENKSCDDALRDSRCLFSVVMPCRNEKNTVGLCVKEALELTKKFQSSQSAGEVLVVDNGSDDGSGELARKAGARVVREERPGYGNALRRGIAESHGEVILIGNRFAGGMEKGAMPFSHKLGVRFLSWFGRKRFHTEVRDFHSGLRGLSRDAAQRLMFHTEGMEFATEMIAVAAKAGMKIGQIPVKLKKCKAPRRSKLRTVRDGMRHLAFMIKG